MKKFWYLLLMAIASCTSVEKEIRFTIASEPWPQGLGSQRAVISVEKALDAAILNLRWRRHDPKPEEKRFIIINEETGDTIRNIYRMHVDRERCELAFGPVENPGTYYFYYLPFKTDEKAGWYRFGYLAREDTPDQDWVSKNQLNDASKIDQIPRVFCNEIQARSAFDSFYPMEVIPTNREKQDYLNGFTGDYLLFPEDRKFPIRMKDEIPYRWIEQPPGDTFYGEASRNEYYAFQIGLFAVRKKIENIRIRFSDLINGEYTIPDASFTCFNTGGIDPYGTEFTKRVDVGRDSVQALWIGVDIPSSLQPGEYTGYLVVDPGNSNEMSVAIKLKINKTILADRGDSEPWRHSRLRWLNSTLGIDDQPVEPYTSIHQDDSGNFNLYGKKIKLAKTGMPASIKVWDKEILKRPVTINIVTGNEQNIVNQSDYRIVDKNGGSVKWSWYLTSDKIEGTGNATLEFDGTFNYKITLTALQKTEILDVFLELPFHPSVGQYVKGMGFRGDEIPISHKTRWEGPHDSFWIGNHKGGLHCELRGSDYHGPMLNLFHTDYPDSWYNHNEGHFSLKKSGDEIHASVHSGKRTLKADEEIAFEFSLLPTPVKKRNTYDHFTNRYYHNARNPWPTEEALDAGVKIINVHHGNTINPYINYPFIATREMKEFIDHWHNEGLKVKIYYTVREITNHTTEIWALRSLGDEILRGSEGSELPWYRGGGYPWLVEHFVNDYTRAWYHPFGDGFVDAAILTAPGDSRWYNYYVEGLSWLAKNIGIDGLYLDDVTYDRRILKRMRKVMVQENSGCIIDLHSCDPFSIGPANQYAEFFPYVDKLWFGEGFKYNEMSPDNWFVEVSGIPFGLMGDMLQDGGNRWLGMVYGMSVRMPWYTNGVYSDPRQVWKVWDDFGIADSEMVGYWEDHCPVRTSSPDVLATVYRKNDRALIALGNWSDEDLDVKLIIDWPALGLDRNKSMLFAPKIKDFQPERTFGIDESIPVKSKQGWLLYVEE